MPFHRARVRHGLDRAVLRRERRREGDGRRTGARITLGDGACARARGGSGSSGRLSHGDLRAAGAAGKGYSTTTAGDPSITSPMTAALAKPSERKIPRTRSHAEGAQETRRPPLVCGSVRSAFWPSPSLVPSFTFT